MDINTLLAGKLAEADSKIVFLIMDPLFGDKLFSLPAAAPVWLIDSSENRQAVTTTRFQPTKPDQYTTFTYLPTWAEADFFESILITIGDHHSASTSWGCYSHLIVIGLSATPLISEIVAEAKMLIHSVFATGFIAQQIA